jgi:hypothetical protein
MWWIILSIGASFLLACLVRKYARHTLINGFMSKEQADDVFPEWRNDKNQKSKKDSQSE